MSYKRPRSTFEADLHAPYAIFGTPLPDEAEARDDGSYVPLWKQEVRDERGRKRLHGAFTGGWSAGYFNTVGSKEGWAPSTFVSSRTNRRKEDSSAAQSRPEDYMDEEDLADAAEAQKIQTSQAFAGLGGSTQDEMSAGGLVGLLRAAGDTMGLKLLRRMGWKDGQGIGPRVRRQARLDLPGGAAGTGEIHLFAPENAPMIKFTRKTDRKGLGHHGESRISTLNDDQDEDEDLFPGDSSRRNGTSVLAQGRPKPKPKQGGIGVGVLNDNGSDEEDPYEIGPKIKYNRVIGGDKKKKKKRALAAANPALGNTPVFVPKLARAGTSLRRCHDGRLPLDGFVLARLAEDLSSVLSQYAPPAVPQGWTSKKSAAHSTDTGYVSTADAAKASLHDARSRAAILGEAALPGKSVFDYLSTSARDKLAAASGKTNLPPGRGEVHETAMAEEQRKQVLLAQIPKLDRDTALAAIARSGGGPYGDDSAKNTRFRSYLDNQADPAQPPPEKARGMTDDEFLREMNEFYNCARIFKPMTGFMASRFTTAKSTSGSQQDDGTADLLSTPEPKVADAAEEAAKMGMFGPMTRKVQDFHPTRLLCKRFNVKAPAHAHADAEPGAPAEPRSHPATARDAPSTAQEIGDEATVAGVIEAPRAAQVDEVNPDRNEAVEGTAAQEEVLRAIFGDSDSDAATIPKLPSHQAKDKSDTLSASQEGSTGSSSSSDLVDAPVHSRRELDTHEDDHHDHRQDDTAASAVLEHPPPPQYPASEASSPRPPPFSSLYAPLSQSAPATSDRSNSGKYVAVAASSPSEGEASGSHAAPAYTQLEYAPFDPDQAAARTFCDPVGETKLALPRDTKGESSRKDEDAAEPPPAYSEGTSPLLTFVYLMAAAGGASSIITQVQQGGPPVNALGDVGADENIAMDLRGTRFVLSRDELLTLPEFVLLSLFPNGLFPDGHMNGFSESDAVLVDYDPASLQYMLDFFRNVAQTIPGDVSPGTSQDGDSLPIEPLGSRDEASRRAGIIVLREDLDFYVIPPRSDITQEEMMEVKRAAARALQQQDGIFSGLKRSDEPGTTEAHLIEMLTAGGFNHDDRWGHRAGEPNKAVICSLALARLRSDIRGNEVGGNAVGMAHKLLLFWRKPARRCWWEGIELENVEGVKGKLKVWIRRVWTLEMSVIGLR
ncbi:hypothetical protein B0I35DRAFT_356305 [Stachybotrys elegans]|uniref:G-patch domain-containing protein n=1 Tax=Stachybotrys elegans TaxID=80388 RepID=A0A8K0WPI1_9HYPO|nr:hypothetical protein B0I35DRAFT_356305 [Stachybotrys elegans]